MARAFNLQVLRILSVMADDPRVPPYVLDTVMADPTAQRLVHLTGMTVQDVRTDLSALIADAIELYVAFDDARRA